MNLSDYKLIGNLSLVLGVLSFVAAFVCGSYTEKYWFIIWIEYYPYAYLTAPLAILGCMFLAAALVCYTHAAARSPPSPPQTITGENK